MTNFDELAKQAFSAVSNLHGEEAVWLSSLSSCNISGKVLFKNPTEPQVIGDSEGYEYRPATASAEYYEGCFPGLREAVDAGSQETLMIRGQAYSVVSIETKFDGKTYVLHLDKQDYTHDIRGL